MERDIIKEKTLHRLYIEAERRNKIRLPKFHINMLKEHIRESYRIKEAYYQKFCEKNGRAFYPWRTQIILSKSEALRIVDEKVKIIDRKYEEIYNDNGKTFSATAFLNKKTLGKHVKKHLSDFPKMKQDNYERYARTFLSQKVDGKRILGFTNKNSFVFRYDREKNIFAKAKPNGAIETFYKPKDGLLYWEEQMDIHGEPKN